MSVQASTSDPRSAPQSLPSGSRATVRRSSVKKSFVSRLWDLLQPMARFWGITTSIVMSGAGAELAVLGYEIAPAVLVGAGMVLILETMWVAALFVDLLCRRGEYTLSLRCWDFTRWSCGRARAPMYACAATALLFADLSLLATISGGMLLVLAALRAAVPFSPYATHGPHSPRAGSSLLSQLDSPMPDVFYNAGHSPDDRFEEMTELEVKTSDRPRSVTPVPQQQTHPLLEL